MTITFIGHGYVGLVTAAVFADLGNTVWVIGHTPEKIENLKKGIVPIYEPGLEEIVKRNVNAKRLLFTLDYDKAIPESQIIFTAVGTPPKDNGEADLSIVFDVSERIGKHLDGYSVVVTKSTVPVGTNRKIKEIIDKVKPKEAAYDIASVPEFLREGQAISDTLRPDRIIIGSDSIKARKLLVELHKPLGAGEPGSHTHTFLTTVETAELTKYAANAFLATKISFANSIAKLAELTGADGLRVLEGIGLDKRIGGSFLQPGAGYGGSCFPKDIRALISIAGSYGYDYRFLKEVEEVNKTATDDIVSKSKNFLKDLTDKTVAVLGLSFKPDTDDMRDAPSISVINSLQEQGAKIRAYDPVAMENAKKILKDVVYSEDAYDAARESDLIIIMTEWNEFRQLDLVKLKKEMKGNALIDGRNVYSPTRAREIGFLYSGVGR